MARAYSVDLRKRVIDAISRGLSTREAARRFSIGISIAGINTKMARLLGRVPRGERCSAAIPHGHRKTKYSPPV